MDLIGFGKVLSKRRFHGNHGGRMGASIRRLGTGGRCLGRGGRISESKRTRGRGQRRGRTGRGRYPRGGRRRRRGGRIKNSGASRLRAPPGQADMPISTQNVELAMSLAIIANRLHLCNATMPLHWKAWSRMRRTRTST